MSLIGPFQRGFPVNFRPRSAGGDSTRDAFGKHIQEIERIYGYLNALDAGKGSMGDIQNVISTISGLDTDITKIKTDINGIRTNITNHINSTAPHPNWKPSLNSLSGNLDAGRVVGNLTQATIDSNKVNGLKAFVEGLIQTNSGGSSVGVNGYVDLGNGIRLMWGQKTANLVVDNQSSATSIVPYQQTIDFNTPFSNSGYCVVYSNNNKKRARLSNVTQTGFTLLYEREWEQVDQEHGTRWVEVNQPSKSSLVHYIAIGR